MRQILSCLLFIFLSQSLYAQRFLPLGEGIKCQGVIYVIKADTTNHKLYVGGYFSGIGGVKANNIAVWDGQKWDSLGAGTDGWVHDIEIIGDTVYVAGIFKNAGNMSLPSLAGWDGSQWIPIANNSFTGLVTDVEFFNRELYITGSFGAIGNTTAIHIGKWNGTAWSTIGNGFDYYPYRMTQYKDKLYFNGPFHLFNGDTAHSVAWIDTAGVTGGFKSNALSNFNYVNQVHLYNDTMYLATSKGVYSFANDTFIKQYPEIHFVYQSFHYQDTLYVAYETDQFDSVNICKVVNQSLQPREFYIDGFDRMKYFIPKINSIAITDSCYYFGGNFTFINNQVSASLGVNTTGGPSPFGNCGVPDYDNYQYAEVKTICQDNQTGNLYVGGEFQLAGDKLSPHVAMWDGSDWHSVGSGFDGPVNSLLFFNDTLYAGGKFLYSGNNPINNLAKWDGTNWVQVGLGADGEVTKLLIKNNNLIIGGGFQNINNQPAQYTAEYNGTSFSELGYMKKLPFPVFDMNMYHGHLYASLYQNGLYKLNGNYWKDKNFPGSYTLKMLKSNDTLFIGSKYGIYAWNDTSYLSIPAMMYQSNYFTPLKILGRYYVSTNFFLAKRDGNGIYYKVYGLTPTQTLDKDSTHCYVAGKFDELTLPYGKYIFNNIGMLEFASPTGSISAIQDTICDFQYVAFSYTSDDLFLTYAWSFPGGIPDTSTHAIETVQYINPGKYPVALSITNEIGSLSITYNDSITVNSCSTGIESITFADILKVYPNPFDNYINIKNTSDETIEFSLRNSLGQNQHEFSVTAGTERQIDFSELSAGIYFLEYRNSTKHSIYKIVKQ